MFRIYTKKLIFCNFYKELFIYFLDLDLDLLDFLDFERLDLAPPLELERERDLRPPLERERERDFLLLERDFFFFPPDIIEPIADIFCISS